MSNGMKSSRKYALQAPLSPSPLSRDSTTAVMPLRLKKKGSFSTAQHTHGLGGEAKDAMLRNSGLRMRRTTSSLRIIATKGNATLSAAISHKVFVPELEMYLRSYARKEDEFAETIPSAMCPFQFVQHDTNDIVPFQRPRATSSGSSSGGGETQKDGTPSPPSSSAPQPPAPPDPAKLNDWLKEMRMKVHVRLVQRQGVTNISTPTESHKLDDKKAAVTLGQKQDNDKRKGGSDTEWAKKGGLDSARKGSNPDLLKNRPDSGRKRGNESDRKKQDSDRKRRGDVYDGLLDDGNPLPARSNSENKVLVRSPSNSSAKGGTAQSPPEARKATVTRGGKGGAPTRPPTTAGVNPFDIGGNQPLFQSRKNPTLSRRTHSAYDVRRVRLKARNSVGLEPMY